MIISLDDIRKIGLTETESQLYYYLLTNNEKTQAEIANALNVVVNRVSVVLKELVEKKLVGSRKIEKTNIYYVTPFENIKIYIEKKQFDSLSEIRSRFDKEKENINTLCEKMLSINDKNRFSVLYINSDEELEKFRNNIFLFNKPKIMFNLNNIDLFKKNTKSSKKHVTELKQHKIQHKNILITSKNTNQITDNDNVVILPSKLFPKVETNINVFSDLVLVSDITSAEKNMILIKNQAFANTIFSIFEYLFNKKRPNC